jgi:hypothetical protein
MKTTAHPSDFRLVPPQNKIVAVQLLLGVRGIIAVPALAGYVRTASGISSNRSSTLAL